MKKIMLIGDSIRGCYEHYVQENMKEIADIWGAPTNSRFAKYIDFLFEDWYADFPADIIHFNCGIWDVWKKNKSLSPVTPLWEYLEDLENICEKMKRTGAKIVFANTTPVDDTFESVDNADVIRYNIAAEAVMKRERIEINDLWSLIHSNPDYINEDRLHLSALGSVKAAEQIECILKKYL